ncbi:hypothetical protein D3C80_2217730 [compost metagenome]
MQAIRTPAAVRQGLALEIYAKSKEMLMTTFKSVSGRVKSKGKVKILNALANFFNIEWGFPGR